MRIAQIICQFRPYKGGMNESVFYLASQLSKEGNEVIVFTPRYKKEDKEKEEMKGFIVRRINPFFKYGNAAFLPNIWKELDGFDIVHLHYPFFGTAEIIWIKKLFTKKKTRLILTYHMDVVGQGFLKYYFFLHTRFIMPHILRCADKITATSLDYFQNSNAKGLKLENKLIELPLGVDLNEYKISERDKNLMARYEMEEDDKILVMLGALDKAHYFKGVDYLLRAFRLIFDIGKGENWDKEKLKLIIAGDGDLRESYQNIAGQLGIAEKVIFIGKPSDEDKIKILNMADIFILPSINQSEAFGMVLIEAMACSKPVIASNLSGVRSVVRDGINGLLSAPKNEEDLAAKIKYLLDNPYIARQMGGKGRELVENIYNWEKIGQQLNEIYKEMMR